MNERITLTLPENLIKYLHKYCPDFKQNKSAFVAKALRALLDICVKEKIDQLLEEGYKVTKDEGTAITKEFESVDLEGLNEY